MAIKLDSAPVQPEMVYDRVFLVRLDINQEHQDEDTKSPKYSVRLRYRLYGVDSDGKRHYSGLGIQTIRLDDYLTEALLHANEGDTTCLDALAKIQDAVAILVAQHRGTTASVI